MEAIRIRELEGPRLFGEFLPLFREALAALPTAEEAPANEEAALREVESGLENCASLFLLAEEDSAPAALLLAVPGSDPFLGWTGSRIRVCYVRPPWRARGLGSRLVARAEEILRSRGVHSLTFELPTQDDALVSIAERHGFVRVRHWLQKDL